MLRSSIALLCSLLIPLHGFLIILFHSSSKIIQITYIVFSDSIALISSFLILLHGLFVVPFYTSTMSIHITHTIWIISISLHFFGICIKYTKFFIP